LGAIIVKTTVAPETGNVPCVVLEEIVTLFLNGVAVTVIDRGAGGGGGGGTGITVRFAEAVAEFSDEAATASTLYVAADVPSGIVFVIPVEALEAAGMLRTPCVNVVGQLPGINEDMVKLRGSHDEVSLFVTVTV
jgi:hypothetical protein